MVLFPNFTIVGLDFVDLICTMFFFSFLGWFYESTIYSIFEQGKLMNRGCFVGPYCPIYSVVAILNIYLLSDITSSFKIVIIASLTVCLVEYVTSYVLEKLFHARYWDYSHYPFNINGRISLLSGLFFGCAVLFLFKVLFPLTVYVLAGFPYKGKLIFTLCIIVIFICDAIFTTIAMCELNRKCKEIYDSVDKYIDDKLDKINSKKTILERFVVVKKGRDIVVKMKGYNQKFCDLEMRLLKDNPAFKSTQYEVIIEKMKYSINPKNFYNKYKEKKYANLESYDLDDSDNNVETISDYKDED